MPYRELQSYLVFAAKSLERIGDHAKNIAEQVIYAVEGKDVRHASDPGRLSPAQIFTGG